MTEHLGDSPDEAHEQLARGAAFLRRALCFWRTPVALLFLGGAACALFLAIRRAAYRSETVILYSEGVRPGDDASPSDNARSVTVRLKEILMSRTSLDTIVKEFDLYPEIRRARGPLDAVEELRAHVAFRAPGGDTFSVAFTGQSPSEAQLVTARLADLVIRQDSDLRRKQAQVTRDFLETEKQATEAGLRDTEVALASFMAAHPRFALDATPLVTGAAIRASLGPAPPLGPSAPQMAARPRWIGAVDRAGTSIVTASPSIAGAGHDAAAEEARANAALAAARANLADLSAHFTAAHPDVRAAEAEVVRATSRLSMATAAASAARAAVGAQVVSAAPTMRSPAPAAPRQPAPVTAVGDVVAVPAPSARAAGDDVVALETDWVKLTRGVTEARQHQDQVESALFKATSAVSSENGGHGVQVTLIDAAFLPQNAVPPGRAVIVAIFVAMSLLLGTLVALGRALVDDRIHGGRDLARLAEILAEIPRESSRRMHVTS